MTTVVQQVGQKMDEDSQVRISVVSYDDVYSFEDKDLYGNLRMSKYHVTQLPLLRSLGYSGDLYKVLSSEQPNIIECQGIWQYYSKVAFDYQLNNKDVRRIVVPHGMLDSWAVKNSAWKKKIVGYLFEYKCLNTSDCIQVLNTAEYESVRQFGLKNPIAIIPNGINVSEVAKKRIEKSKKKLLFIGRIHPKKGLHELMEGISLLQQESPQLLSSWKVRIAGWNQLNYQEDLLKLRGQLGLNDIVDFIGPVFGEEKRKELQNADAFILPSFSEGLPMTILEAWSFKLPCLMTDYCNLQEGFDSAAAIRIEPNAQSICDGLGQLFSMTSSMRMKMGVNGLKLCERKYTWKNIANQKIELYNWLLGNGARPDFVLID